MQLESYIEGYIQYVLRKHKTPNKYENLDLYLESEFKYVASEYNFSEWLGNTSKNRLLTPENMCKMFNTIRQEGTPIDLTSDILLREYAYWILYYMPVDKIKTILELS